MVDSKDPMLVVKMAARRVGLKDQMTGRSMVVHLGPTRVHWMVG